MSPARVQLPVCGQELAPPGALGQAGGTATQTFRQTEGKRVQGSQTHTSGVRVQKLSTSHSSLSPSDKLTPDPHSSSKKADPGPNCELLCVLTLG